MYHDTQEYRPATILAFPRKRGRPRKALRGPDHGTPELAQKRRRGETIETLDLCLERGLITQRQHWCGVHLRWLFTLRYGAPGVRAIDPAHTRGFELKADDPAWRQEREQEYIDAINTLRAMGQALLVMNVCIYNERPRMLCGNEADAKSLCDFTARLSGGLDVLSGLWP